MEILETGLNRTRRRDLELELELEMTPVAIQGLVTELSLDTYTRYELEIEPEEPGQELSLGCHYHSH